MDTWLPLTEYSTKYKVSISTLRRRIKTDEIKFRFDDGKYFIIDESVSTHQRAHRPSQDSEKPLMGTPLPPLPEKVAPIAAKVVSQAHRDEPILTAANKLLNELKRAYTLILQEKEEQILYLKGEVVDLKTLVRVLESENARLANK